MSPCRTAGRVERVGGYVGKLSRAELVKVIQLPRREA